MNLPQMIFMTTETRGCSSWNSAQFSLRFLGIVAFLFVFMVGGQVRAVAQSDGAPVPQASPIPQMKEQVSVKEQTKRILGLIPNFRAVSTDTVLPPQSTRVKFATATEDSFDYSSIFIPAMLAGYSMGTNSTPQFGHGVEGYGQYFWRAAVDQTTENYLVEFVVPSLAHQDTRYYTLGRGGFVKRTGYALSRVVVTRGDSANAQFNISEVLGAGGSAALSSTYYPSSQRDFADVGKQWGVNIGVDAISFVAKEFWPDINYHLFRGSRPGVNRSDVPMQ